MVSARGEKEEKSTVFLPHIGLGGGDLWSIELPTLLYQDPLPLLLFDKVVLDRSIRGAFGRRDEFEMKLLEKLEELGVVEVVDLCDMSRLEPRCCRLFSDFHWESHGTRLLPPRIADKDIDVSAFKRQLVKHKHGMNLLEPFKEFAETYLSLQAVRDSGIPSISSDRLQMAISGYILSRDRRRKARSRLSSMGTAYEGLKTIWDLHGPSVPLLVASDGSPIGPLPIFLRGLGFHPEREKEKELDEDRSWQNLDRLLGLRSSPLLSDFRRYIQEVSTTCRDLPQEEAKERFKVEHSRRLLILQNAIAEEYRWIDRFAKVSGYLSIPLGLAGFGIPPLGVASAGLAIGAAAADVAQHALIRKREKDPAFYQEHEEFRWRLFLADLESIYSRKNFLKRVKDLMSSTTK